MNREQKYKYLEIYKSAHNNAVDLLKEAEILFEYQHFARAYALAFTALEEISKSQFAADVFTGLHTKEDFEKFYKNHKRKIDRVEWAHLDANSYHHNLKWIGFDINDLERLNPQKPYFKKRLESLYVGIDLNIITKPEEQVTQEDTKEIINLVEVSLERILEVELNGNQIGTKGFMK